MFLFDFCYSKIISREAQTSASISKQRNDKTIQPWEVVRISVKFPNGDRIFFVIFCRIIIWIYHSQLQPWKPIVNMLRTGASQHVFLFIGQFGIDLKLFLSISYCIPNFQWGEKLLQSFMTSIRNLLGKQQRNKISKNSVWVEWQYSVFCVFNIVVPGTIETIINKTWSR